MIETPAFLDTSRPDVPDLVVSRGVIPFHLAGSPVRGRLIRLGPLADALLSRHDAPQAALALAGKALTLIAGMSTALKFQGSYSLQIKGDGPVSQLVADCTERGDLRVYLRAEGEAPSSAPDAALVGAGYLAFTLDQGAETERHQGIVAITGESLAEMAMHYYETSEQHPCWIALHAARRDEGWQAGGLVIERIAGEGGLTPAADAAQAEDDWATARILAATVTQDEILDPALDGMTLINRLFGTMDPRIDRPRALAFGCRCSRARLSALLATFPRDDLDHMAEEGTIVMTCEFCNVHFRFSRDEVAGAPGPAA
ncbi:Hsp33 family molecular chaperone HslO [Acidomonas methanolica]|uniref:Heat shock protein Hsp33 n=2 Tax=Acidomonas methanolica TaxID=437 RepID=A0A023D4H6_ACIMT|nr:Hsp33 family molecular chaperone HslO [Acidomonas methanolica]MBU2653944.1 Hsp33 family molecular chaperone HslO [Acidomonas methanolica]GAJ28686.1 heat shock protein Hsp33 [Acidomonas methanolica NBRC 104435]GEK98298.1 33 kDa chaperonin [Acidomonas methanolica NBRC 104435]